MAQPCSALDRLSLPDPFPIPAAWQAGADAALFSACGRYRWWLVRRWRAERSPVLFLGLNPSTANGARDDPTLRRLLGLASHWGHGQVLVLNLFSRVGSDPAQLRRSREPVGEHTDAWLATALGWLGGQPEAPEGPPPRLWLGWGQRGGLQGRSHHLMDVLQCWGGEVVCLGLTRQGHPRHPLYTSARQPPLPFVVPSAPCLAFPVVTPFT